MVGIQALTSLAILVQVGVGVCVGTTISSIKVTILVIVHIIAPLVIVPLGSFTSFRDGLRSHRVLVVTVINHPL